MSDILDELLWRDLVAQSTDLGVLAEDLATGPMTLYCGFDPTAPSLHLGNLAQILTVRRFQQAGHRPLALVGGATGLIGDPKMTAERTLNPADVVAGWVQRIRGQLERYYDFSGSNAAVMVDNYEWTAPISVLDFLRDVGKHFSVNRMLDREAVAARLAGPGISFTEFSYQLLQSHDYLQLYRKFGCRLQTGGSDQWGNIVAGVDLIRRTDGGSAHALTTPLLVKADGTKFGKTEGGTIWLDPDLTSPYAFFQFWLNADDRDVPTLLRMYSFRPRDEIDALVAATTDRPAAREGQRALAQELTALVHGEAEVARATAAASALFGSGSLADLDDRTLAAALTEAGVARIDPEEIVGGVLPDVVELLVRSGVAASRSAARRTITEGGAYLNNVRITPDDGPVPVSTLLGGRWLVVRRGRRTIAGLVVADTDGAGS